MNNLINIFIIMKNITIYIIIIMLETFFILYFIYLFIFFILLFSIIRTKRRKIKDQNYFPNACTKEKTYFIMSESAQIII